MMRRSAGPRKADALDLGQKQMVAWTAKLLRQAKALEKAVIQGLARPRVWAFVR